MEKEIRKNSYRKKAFLLAFFYMLLNIGVSAKNNSSKSQSNYSYQLNDSFKKGNDEPFATYGEYEIFFVNKQGEILTNDENDVYIVDSRSKFNSSFKICDSYRITNEEDMLNIIAIILKYEEMYPSKWTRTMDGLIIEWYVHNVCYEMNILVERSKDVDLDHKDALFFESDIIKFILGK